MARFLNKKRDLSSKIKLDDTTPFYMVYYLEPQSMIYDDGRINELKLDLKSKPIPGELKDLFIETFGDGLRTINSQALEEFIQNNIRR